MSLKITIIPEAPKAVTAFVEHLPESFKNGEVIYNRRNTVSRFQLSEESTWMIVKRFRSPRLIQSIGTLFRGSKARRAWRNALRLIELGFSTPQPLAFVETKTGTGYSYLVTTETSLPPIQRELERPANFNKALAADFGRFVALLHSKGVLHHDLNSTNVLFDVCDNRRYRFSLIDINRMTFISGHIPSEQQCIDNLLRFTGRMDVLEAVTREYAIARDIEVEPFVKKVLAAKLRHDYLWRLRKRICHPFRRH